jgi:hypothetical protein
MNRENAGNKEGVDMDIKSRVMGRINKEEIRIKSPWLLLAQKVGLRSVLVLSIFGGALLIDIIFYLLQKMGSLEFLSLGIPGLQIFLQSFPYDYLALFALAMLIGNFLLKKLDMSRGWSFFANAPLLFFFALAILVGLFFGKMGIGEIIKSWSLCRLPKEISAYGEIVDIFKNEIIIRTMDGQLEKIVLDKESDFLETFDYTGGRFLRATGIVDEKNSNIFYSKQIKCCYEE